MSRRYRAPYELRWWESLEDIGWFIFWIAAVVVICTIAVALVKLVFFTEVIAKAQGY